MHNEGAACTTTPSYIRVRAVVWAYGRGQTHTHKQTQTRVTTIHFASSTTHAKCNNNTSMQPPESLVRRQSLLLPARKRSMLTSMADTSLRTWALSTHQLAGCCRISVGKFPRVQGKTEKRAFCSKDARCSCNVSMPYCFMTVYQPMTAPTECSYPSLYFL